ncbi:MAG: amidohydrolase family protein [Treponema sp.]|jgi:dihydroorotase|nr:amidohydrolase family protein [Treponema sp.]
MPSLVLKNFRIIDEDTDMTGSVAVEGGLIGELIPAEADYARLEEAERSAAMVIDGRNFPGTEGRLPLLMPAFVDLHAHFRDPGFFEKGDESGRAAEIPAIAETLESACLAAAAGGYGTVVCMANTKPPVDNLEQAAFLKGRADALGLIDLYPALSLTKNMEGRELSDITKLRAPGDHPFFPRLLSEDGRDIAGEALFLAALKEARRLGLPVSCHCDAGGAEAAAAKAAGSPRGVWSRIEENNATRRAIALGMQAGARIHIAHVSTMEAAEMIRQAKAPGRAAGGFALTCEAAPHHIACTDADARRLGDESFGRVNPPLRTEADRRALIAAVLDGTIDAVATDHAPHTGGDKAAGAPGFTGLETAFAACFTRLVPAEGSGSGLKKLSSLMSAGPARIIGLGAGPGGRGRIAAGLRADLCIAGDVFWTVEPGQFRSRGKTSPFAGQRLRGKIMVTINQGRVVYDARRWGAEYV